MAARSLRDFSSKTEKRKSRKHIRGTFKASEENKTNLSGNGNTRKLVEIRFPRNGHLYQRAEIGIT